MTFSTFRWRSIKTRVTLVTLPIFLFGIWSLELYASRILRADMERQLGDQQFATVSLLAADIDQKLADRMSAMHTIAASITPDLLAKPAALQSLLEQRPIFQQMFNGGTFVMTGDGTAIAEVPLSAQRIGVNYMNRDFIVAALKEGRSTISRPVMGAKLMAPIIGMTVPIRDPEGRVIGALAGVTNLGLPNFLDKVMQSRYGQTGGYLLVAPQYRLVVTASDKGRIMETLPGPGANPAIDHFIDGYEGYAILTNPMGVEVLAAAKRIPTANWYLAATLPTKEAFAPLRTQQQHMLLATLLLTLLIGALLWWRLSRKLSPMLKAMQTLTELAETERPMQALPIAAEDEIGALIAGFNRLLTTLGQRSLALRESDQRFHDLVDSTDGIVWEADARSFVFNYVSKNATRMLGYPVADWLAPGFWASHIFEPDREQAIQYCVSCTGRLENHDFEYRFVAQDGRVLWLRDIVKVVEEAGQPRWLRGLMVDITQHKQADEALRIAATAFESQVGIIITDAQAVILRVNKAFTEITGYPAEEAVGKTPRLLSSGRQDPAFYRAMWEQLLQVGSWQGEIWNRTRLGEVYAEGLTISAVKDRAGRVTHYVGTFTDITARKQMEEQIRQLAFHDPLTQLPNRRLLTDRLSQAMAASKRSGCYGALIVLDLDNFKPLNDRHGHAAGDLLLVEAAERLKRCVREIDTVARFGGDEFVAVLNNLNVDKAASAAEATLVAEKIRLTLSQPYRLRLGEPTTPGVPIEHHCTASIGVVLFRNHEASADDVLKWADNAMYQAKAAGRNLIRFCDPTA